MNSNQPAFLQKLQTEAKKQAKLQDSSLLPKKLEPLAAVIANYPVQTLLFLSLLTAFILELINLI